MPSQRDLIGRYIRDISPGTLRWIGLRPQRREPMLAVDHVTACEGLGLEGDHRCAKTPGSARQVSMISTEFIAQIEHFSGHQGIRPEQLRRNLVVENLNLHALRHQYFSIGEAIFQATAVCHPCSRMDQSVGHGTVAAMLGHGGLCAKVLVSGRIAVGDSITVLHDYNL